MKKLLVVFDGIRFSSSLSRFALQIAKRSNSLVHAVFTSPSMNTVVQYPFPNDLPLAAVEFEVSEEMEKENRDVINANIQVFNDNCKEADVNFTVDNDSDITIRELIDHSAFSDLILCDCKGEMGGFSIRELLAETHCPILLVPENAILPERMVFCYDESFSSIYAMKMFSYLFPEWKDLPGVLLSINPKGDNGNGHDEYLADWLPQHFTNIEQEAPAGNLQRELVSFIRKNEEPTIVVMGSLGGNTISRLFHKSLANVVLEETNATVFIMHE